MAKPEHLKILQKGKKAWNKWRKKHPDESPNLYKAELMEMDLSEANLTGADLSEANLMGANLKGADLSQGNLMGVNFCEADLSEANLTEANLTGAKLMGANLKGVNLSQAKLDEADLSEADLNQADLTQAKIREAVVKGTNLMEANLSGADLTGTLLADAANLTPQQLSSAILDGDAQFEPAPETSTPPAVDIEDKSAWGQEPSAAETFEGAETPEPSAADNLEPEPSLEEEPVAETLETAKAAEPVAVETLHGTPTDLVPTHSDDPTEIDELGGRPFAQILAERIHEVWARPKKNQWTTSRKTEEMPGEAFGVLIHGPWGSGKTSLLNFLRQELVSGGLGQKWMVVDFNAWRHQGMGPPWWALLNAIYRQRFRALRKISFFRALRLVIRDRWWRFQAGRAFQILTGALILWGIWFMTEADLEGNVETILRTLAGLMTLWGVGVLFSRFWLMGSRRSAEIFMEHHRDPVPMIVRHFKKMVQGACQPCAVFIDDLDRCEGSYVVELLEGIQTLFHESKVVFVVAADRKWLRASYEHSYGDFNGSIGQAGHPLSHLFLEKMFQISVPVPRMPVATQRRYWDRLTEMKASKSPKEVETELRRAEKEAEKIMGRESDEEKILFKIHDHGGDVLVQQALLDVAAKRIMQPAARKKSEHLLQPFVDLLDPNPRAMKRFVNAYAFRKAIALLGGGDMETGPLALWTLMELRWPLLADYLTDHPEMVERIGSELASDGIPADIKELFTDGAVLAVVQGNDPVRRPALDEMTIRKIVGR
ncbi:MAG: pentapeptide repeat-containing protein [Acidobacteria bacterium]|nr:pentapeptide repeat-containing protein [Acidobacteriota bacterium]